MLFVLGESHRGCPGFNDTPVSWGWYDCLSWRAGKSTPFWLTGVSEGGGEGMHMPCLSYLISWTLRPRRAFALSPWWFPMISFFHNLKGRWFLEGSLTVSRWLLGAPAVLSSHDYPLRKGKCGTKTQWVVTFFTKLFYMIYRKISDSERILQKPVDTLRVNFMAYDWQY